MIKPLVRHRLLAPEALGTAPLSQTGTHLLLEVPSDAPERAGWLVPTNGPFEPGTPVCHRARLPGAVLDPLDRHVSIFDAHRKSDRLRESQRRRAKANS